VKATRRLNSVSLASCERPRSLVGDESRSYSGGLTLFGEKSELRRLSMGAFGTAMHAGKTSAREQMRSLGNGRSRGTRAEIVR
jgi:hypothetical protein